MPRPTLLPILDENLDEFAGFLEANMGGRTAAEWRKAFDQGWCDEKPNNGFMLHDGSRMVGAIGGIYATRLIRGNEERFCNITSWYVKPEFRSQSLRLVTALTAQPGYHFTDFTATKRVADSLTFLKFKPLDSRQILLPTLPLAAQALRRKRVIEDPAAMQSELDQERAKVAFDHSHIPWLHQVLLDDPRGSTHVIYKVVACKYHSCAFVLGVNDQDAFGRNVHRFARHILLRHGLLSIRVEQRFLTRAPWAALALKRFPRKLYRSPTLQDQDIDNLYSEVAALDMRAEFV